MRRTSLLPLLLLVLNAADLHAQQADSLAGAGMLRVTGVVIDGNRVTRDRVILREMTVKEGDTLGSGQLYARLKRSEQNLRNTGLFNTVLLLPAYLGSGEVIVEVRVNERWYLWPSPILELGDPNFNIWWRTKDLSRINWGMYLYQYNFRGNNETVYLKLQFGYARQYALRYKVPYLDREGRWSLNVGGSWFEQKEITIGTEDNDRIFHRPVEGNARTAWRVDTELGFRRRHDLRHALRLAWVEADVVDSVALRAPDYFGQGATSTSFPSLGYSIIWDTRDSRVFARSGHYGELKLDHLGLGLPGTAGPDITTAYAALRKWWKLGDRFTLAGSLSGKRTFGGEVPYFVQEGLGYSHYVRGYEYYIIDGQDFALGKLNAILLLFAPREYYLEPIPLEAFRTLYVALYLDLFVDVGRVWDTQYAALNPLANTWMNGFGAGLDLVTSYDQVLRGEVSFNGRGESGFFLHFTQPF